MAATVESDQRIAMLNSLSDAAMEETQRLVAHIMGVTGIIVGTTAREIGLTARALVEDGWDLEHFAELLVGEKDADA